MANKPGSSSTTDQSQLNAELYTFTKQYIEDQVKATENNLSSRLEDLVNKSNEKSGEFIRNEAEKIRNQVLTALALFAAFFSLISSSSLILIKSPTVPSMLVVIAALSIILLVFLSIFFVFLNGKIPSARVLWLPIAFFVVFVAVIFVCTSKWWTERSISTPPTESAQPTK